MEVVKKAVKEAPADRDSLIDSIVEMRFPEYLYAEEVIEDSLALDRNLTDHEFEQELENIARTKWSDDLGLTASQHEAIREGFKLASELKAMPMHQLKLRYEEEIANEEERRAFFNKPEAMADFTYWARADCWTLEEAVALCLGREPKAVNSSTLEEWRDEAWRRQRSKFVAQFERNLDLARRAQQVGALQEPVPPKSFLDWTDGKGIDYPAALRDDVIAHQDDNSRSDDGSEDTQELATLREEIQKLKAELAEANKKPKPTLYTVIYVLAAERLISKSLRDDDISSIVNFILKKAPHHKLTPDDEPVRDCLREAKEYVARTVARRSPSP